jgi:hypothetical protein
MTVRLSKSLCGSNSRHPGAGAREDEGPGLRLSPRRQSERVQPSGSKPALHSGQPTLGNTPKLLFWWRARRFRETYFRLYRLNIEASHEANVRETAPLVDVLINVIHMFATAVWLGGAIFIQFISTPSVRMMDPRDVEKVTGNMMPPCSAIGWTYELLPVLTG